MRTTGGDYEVTVYDGAFQYCKKVSGSTTYEKNYSQVEGGVEIRTLPTGVTTYPADINDNIVYQLPDNLGGVNIRLDTSGALIDKEEHYPFGDTSLRTFLYKRYRYVGKEKDSESGLYYYGARYYASWTCRFISVDPLAKQYAHLTPYNYADNNPINDIDIDGMQTNNSSKSQESINTPQKHAAGCIDEKTGEYQIEQGDWLSAIAARFGTTVDQLVKINNLADPNKIERGAKIKVNINASSFEEDPRSDVPVNKPFIQKITKKVDVLILAENSGLIYDTVVKNTGKSIVSDNQFYAGIGTGAPGRSPTGTPPGGPIGDDLPPLPTPGSKGIPSGLARAGAAILIAGAIYYFTHRTNGKTYEGTADIETEQESPLTYVTYTKYNPTTGKTYVGRTMGYGTPAQIVRDRDVGHHKTAEGYGPARPDVSFVSTKPYLERHSDPSYQAIRGREQLLIDYFGGAWSMQIPAGDTSKTKSGNAINGIALNNPMRGLYLMQARLRGLDPNKSSMFSR